MACNINWSNVVLNCCTYRNKKDITFTLDKLHAVTEVFFDKYEVDICYIVAEDMIGELLFYQCSKVTNDQIKYLTDMLKTTKRTYAKKLLQWKGLPVTFDQFRYSKALSSNAAITNDVKDNLYVIDIEDGVKLAGNVVDRLDIYKFNKFMHVHMPGIVNVPGSEKTFYMSISGLSYPRLTEFDGSIIEDSNDESDDIKSDQGIQLEINVKNSLLKFRTRTFSGSRSAMKDLYKVLNEIVSDNVIKELLVCEQFGSKNSMDLFLDGKSIGEKCAAEEIKLKIAKEVQYEQQQAQFKRREELRREELRREELRQQREKEERKRREELKKIQELKDKEEYINNIKRIQEKQREELKRIEDNKRRDRKQREEKERQERELKRIEDNKIRESYRKQIKEREEREREERERYRKQRKEEEKKYSYKYDDCCSVAPAPYDAFNKFVKGNHSSNNYVNDDCCTVVPAADNGFNKFVKGNHSSNNYVDDDCCTVVPYSNNNLNNNNLNNNSNNNYQYKKYNGGGFGSLNEENNNLNNDNNKLNDDPNHLKSKIYFKNNDNNGNYLNLKHWKEQDYEKMDDLQIVFTEVGNNLFEFRCDPKSYPHRTIYSKRWPEVQLFTFGERQELDDHKVFVSVPPFTWYYFRRVLSYLIFQINYAEGKKFYFAFRCNCLSAIETALEGVFNIMYGDPDTVQETYRNELDEHPYDISLENKELFKEWTGGNNYKDIPISAKEQMIIITTRWFSQNYFWPRFQVIKGKIISYNIGSRCGTVVVCGSDPINAGKTYRFFPTDLIVNSLPAIPLMDQEVYGVVVSGVQKVKKNNTYQVSNYKKHKLFQWLSTQLAGLSPCNPKYGKFKQVMSNWSHKNYLEACHEFHKVFGMEMRLPPNKVDEDAELKRKSKLTMISLAGLQPVLVNVQQRYFHPNCAQRKPFVQDDDLW